MIADQDYLNDGLEIVEESLVINGYGVDMEAKTGKITFEQPKPNPSSKEGKRLKRSGKPFRQDW